MRRSAYLASALSPPAIFTVTSTTFFVSVFSPPLAIMYTRPSWPTNFLSVQNPQIADSVSLASFLLSNVRTLMSRNLCCMESCLDRAWHMPRASLPARDRPAFLLPAVSRSTSFAGLWDASVKNFTKIIFTFRDSNTLPRIRCVCYGLCQAISMNRRHRFPNASQIRHLSALLPHFPTPAIHLA